MSRKKTVADSAAKGVARNRNDGSTGYSDPGNVIAEMIEQIEVMLTTDDFAYSFLEWPDSARTDIMVASQISASTARCHASLSYIRGHQAWSIDLHWNGRSRTIRDYGRKAIG